MINPNISYVMGGGILTALRWAWKIGVFFWYIFIFPLDLMAFIMGLVVYLSILAKKYLSYYKVKNPQQNQMSTRIGTSVLARIKMLLYYIFTRIYVLYLDSLFYLDS